nr:Rho termination factor N-terminal domain-containing protein [Rhodococcus erythropolis]
MGRSGGTSSRHKERTVEELKEQTKELDLHGYSKLKKSELIDTLRRH